MRAVYRTFILDRIAMPAVLRQGTDYLGGVVAASWSAGGFEKFEDGAPSKHGLNGSADNAQPVALGKAHRDRWADRDSMQEAEAV